MNGWELPQIDSRHKAIGSRSSTGLELNKNNNKFKPGYIVKTADHERHRETF